MTIDADDVFSMDHNIAGFFVIHLKNVLDHLCLISIEYALFVAFVYHGNDLIFCYLCLK